MTIRLCLAAFALVGCTSSGEPAQDAGEPRQPRETVSVTVGPSPVGTPSAPVLMPDLVGRPGRAAYGLLGSMRARGALLDVTQGGPVAVRCGLRPGAVARQTPPAGTPLVGRVEVVVRLGALDLGSFRGPCPGRALGAVGGADAAVVRALYEFAVDPAAGADGLFAPGSTWVGIEAGPTSRWLDAEQRGEAGAWEFDVGYAERVGPHSALDLLAASGGWYDAVPGVVPTCGTGRDGRPHALAGVRALSVVVPRDVEDSCGENGWGVRVFVDRRRRIAGVALRLGSP